MSKHHETSVNNLRKKISIVIYEGEASENKSCCILGRNKWKQHLFIKTQPRFLFMKFYVKWLYEWEREIVGLELFGFTPCWDRYIQSCFIMFLSREIDIEQPYNLGGRLALSSQRPNGYFPPDLLLGSKTSVTYIFPTPTHFFPRSSWGISAVPWLP